MGNKKLSALLLEQSSTVLSGFSQQASTLNFSVKTGASGSALVRVYGAVHSAITEVSYGTLALKKSGVNLRSVSLRMGDIQNRRSSASPYFEYVITGQAPNITLDGFQVSMTGGSAFYYVGYSVWPY